MDAHALISGGDTLLMAFPFLLLLLLSMFRLDERIAAPRRLARNRRSACGVDEFGVLILCDPDGRRSNEGVRRPGVRN
jgi:hypothetical protein